MRSLANQPYAEVVQQHQAYKYALRPTGQQERDLRRFAGACRFVYNRGLALQQARYEAGEKKLSYAGLCKELTKWRNGSETPWLKGAPAQPLQQSLKDLEAAYRNFFEGRARFPRFKKKGRSDSFRYPDPRRIHLDQGNDRIFLPKLGWVRYRNSRTVEGEIRNVTVSHSGGRWFVSINTLREVEPPLHPSVSMVGIDVGVASLATLSTGEQPLESIDAYRKAKVRLARLQRSLARKRKFSRNWRKQNARIQKLHARIANLRRDALHKATTTISKTHAMIVIEDLNVRGMSASAKGTIDAPGRNVRAKAGLNAAILDQGWGEFRRQLEYKQDWRGGRVLAVPAQNTSRRCSACGHASPENRKTQAVFHCVSCGHREHADVNAAKNILAAGHAVLAHGEPGAVGPLCEVGTRRSEATLRGGPAVGIPAA